MPDVDEQLGALAGCTIFTTLDLSNCSLQIPLTEQAKDKTAFVTENVTARFERMPFGLKGAQGTFQKLMNLVFKDLNEAGLGNTYLDDIIIPSASWEDLMRDLLKVLEALVKARFTLKPAKCHFGAEQLDYLGYRISKGVVKPGRKVEAITNFPIPKDAHEIRRFLGLLGYFRRFIVNYAIVAEPLTRLTGKDVPYQWGPSQETAFENLKKVLSLEPVVRMYDPSAAVTEVHTNANSKALSGILLQGPKTTNLHMVYAVSKKKTNAESLYHFSRLELYAIIWTINRLRPYLLGTRFTVVTDCQVLTYLNLHKSTKPQIARWYEALQEYDFDIRYHPGSKMAHVDALSHGVDDDDSTTESVDDELAQHACVFVAMSVHDRVRFMQQGEPTTREQIRKLELIGPKTKQASGDLVNYEVINGILHRRYVGRLPLVVPKQMRKGIVIAAHDYGGHFALDRTVAKISKDFWFSQLRRYVRQHIRMCLECLTHKRPSGKRQGLLHPIPPGRRPFQVINVDHLGPFETSPQLNRYLLVIVDNLTKYVHMYPCKTTDAKSLIRIMTMFIETRGIPDQIISDRGSCFTSRPFEQFCTVHNIEHILNSTRHPQVNGQVERANRTIVTLLGMSTDDQRRWDT